MISETVWNPAATHIGSAAEVDWRDGAVPVSRAFHDPYFSLIDGLEETRHVFLAGNDLPARFIPGFHIAELGFGTGLNMLAVLDSAQRTGLRGKLRFTSFEAHPMATTDIRHALSTFAELSDLAEPFLEAWSSGARRFSFGQIDAEVIIGDVRETLPNWDGRADAWFLDGFSPARNPEMWQPDLMAQVGAHTAPGGTFATYTAAGFVRRGLEAAGFNVTRRPGYGSKRHMTSGRLA